MVWIPGESNALARHARASRRVRFEIAALAGNPALARAVEREAAQRPGVVSVTASAVSGRVLIEYAPGASVAEDLDRLARRPPAFVRPARAAAPAHWHAEATDAVIARLATSARDGLTEREARARLEATGGNVLAEEESPSRLALIASQVANLPNALLGGSTLISLLLGDWLEASAIVAVVGMNAAIGYRVERHSEDLLAAWRAAELGRADVIRSGALCSVPAPELVPGDLLVVSAGTVVSADARVVDAHRLAADEAALTGESEPVDKTCAPVARDAPLAERRTMLYRGTSVASGHGRAIVVATGGATEIARVQELAAESRAPKARLQRRLNALASRLAWSGLAAAAGAGLASLAHRRNPVEILRDSVALGVAAIPEGLPVTATSALVRAMARMRERGIVVRRLATAEALGAITVACTDKTGTLTENRMRLERVSLLDGDSPRTIDAGELHAPGPDSLDPRAVFGPIAALLAAGVLNSDIEYLASGELAGSSTERALVEAAQRVGLDPRVLRETWPRRRLVERSDDIRYVVSEHARDLEIIKGAPEQVVPLCALDPRARDAVLAENAALAGDGLRVLAIGSRRIGARAWRYLGLVALRDPLRAGSATAVHAAARAGIRTIILTGDQRATAEAIARQARLAGDVIEGHELPELLAARDAAARLRRVAVIARVAPADKVAVVEALRRHGEVVAMAGDGINDAPALRAADVGIAVGARSTDLARQTADVVLERADLRSILEAVAEGRAVQDNLRRSIRFQAAGNLGEILLATGAALAGQRLIGSLGLLWINLLTDTLPGLALALEPSDGALLERPPVHPDKPILDRADWRRVARDGAMIAGVSGAAAIVGGPIAAFAAIGATQFAYAAACRAPDRPLTRRFAALVGGSAALHLLAVASGPARALLRISGSSPLALAGFAAGAVGPLYIAWRRQATREIVRLSSQGATT
ncbi:MAG TPA: cation-transporting P-type ATPase [Kofleriaceae bacterium]|nr:cation-transporting P-type ATPase [Kofleriaceae bacterium]